MYSPFCFSVGFSSTGTCYSLHYENLGSLSYPRRSIKEKYPLKDWRYKQPYRHLIFNLRSISTDILKWGKIDWPIAQTGTLKLCSFFFWPIPKSFHYNSFTGKTRLNVPMELKNCIGHAPTHRPLALCWADQENVNI